jgi:hypothetical protein
LKDFDYFIVFYALLLGLALTELLSGYANLVRAQTRPKWGVVAPLTGLLLFFEIWISFIDAWTNLQCLRITLKDLAVPTLMGLTYFAAAVIAVPQDYAQWQSLDDYFYARRKWIAGLLILANLLHLPGEWQYVQQTWARGESGAIAEYAGSNLWLFGSYLAIFLARVKWLTVLGICGVLLFFVYVYSAPDFGVFTGPVDCSA